LAGLCYVTSRESGRASARRIDVAVPATVPSEPTLARARGTLYRRASFAIASAATAFYAVFMARTAFSVGGRTYFSLFDDAMISMRYARNLAHGAGLVWNAGQHPVEGYTNSLWTVWMAVLHLTGVSDAKASLLVMLSGAAILVANLFVVRAIVETLAPGGRRDARWGRRGRDRGARGVQAPLLRVGTAEHVRAEGGRHRPRRQGVARGERARRRHRARAGRAAGACGGRSRRTRQTRARRHVAPGGPLLCRRGLLGLRWRRRVG